MKQSVSLITLGVSDYARAKSFLHSARLLAGAQDPRAGFLSGEWRTGMGNIVVSDNISLDGVIQDPAGDEGFARGGWEAPRPTWCP